MPIRPAGLYACIDLGGAPVDPVDRAALGLRPDLMPAIEGLDALLPQQVSRCDDGDRVCVVVGSLHAPPDPRRSAAQVMLERIDRLGIAAVHDCGGEWSALAWSRSSGALRVIVSATMRDPVFYQRRGNRVAVAPSMLAFHRLAWDGGEFDETALPLQVGRQRLRRGRGLGDATFLRGVRAVLPGSMVAIGRDGTLQRDQAPPRPAQVWNGTFDAAVASVTDMLQSQVGDAMVGHRHIAVLTSGGLDSSLIAWLAHRQAAGRPLTLISSVAPSGSGLPDERHWSNIVAQALGLPIRWIVPDPMASPYRPSGRALAAASSPLFGPRHYLYDALYDGTVDAGASLLFDGLGGEGTVTALYPHRPWRQRVRRWWKDRRRGAAEGRAAWPARAFHVRLARHRLAALPADWQGLWQAPQPARTYNDPRHWGIALTARMMQGHPTEAVAGRLRLAYPFRDTALMARFAGLPINYLRHGGMDRAFVRAMLDGHLPDSIRLRPKGTAFSPDYGRRLVRHAPAARARLHDFRSADLDDWFDLDWLDAALRRIEAGSALAFDTLQAQTTMNAAEYLLWLRLPSRAR